MHTVGRALRHPLILRLATSVVTLFGVALVIFVVLHVLPGNQVTASLGVSAGLLTPEQRAALDRYYGIGEPLPQQFASWLGSLLTGNLGVSVIGRQPVAALVATALPVTLELAVVAIILGLLWGIGLGVLSASRPRGLRDGIGQAVAVAGLGVPSFVIGTGLVSFLASAFGYFPNSEGYVSPLVDPLLNLQQILLPALALSLGIGAAVMRTTRSSLLEVVGQHFVRTARGKGLAESTVLWRHVFRNALLPILTMSGIQFGYLLGGTVIIEQIFVLPGLGRLLLEGIGNRDYALVQSITMLFAAGFVLVNLLVDVLYTYADPRVRLQ
ncbi:MAG TPA: ABC transporter permease [Candidatus Dormibacteraeota bacterium]|nr:ABC transporter permease [Candidatus Dormibacteraeota bacterium]